jgi:hypothetical protein
MKLRVEVIRLEPPREFNQDNALSVASLDV